MCDGPETREKAPAKATTGKPTPGGRPQVDRPRWTSRGGIGLEWVGFRWAGYNPSALDWSTAGSSDLSTKVLLFFRTREKLSGIVPESFLDFGTIRKSPHDLGMVRQSFRDKETSRHRTDGIEPMIQPTPSAAGFGRNGVPGREQPRIVTGAGS